MIPTATEFWHFLEIVAAVGLGASLLVAVSAFVNVGLDRLERALRRRYRSNVVSFEEARRVSLRRAMGGR